MRTKCVQSCTAGFQGDSSGRKKIDTDNLQAICHNFAQSSAINPARFVVLLILLSEADQSRQIWLKERSVE